MDRSSFSGRGEVEDVIWPPMFGQDTPSLLIQPWILSVRSLATIESVIMDVHHVRNNLN